MSQTICFDVVCLENVLLRHTFSGPQPPVRAADFGTKCLLWHHLATSVTKPSNQFSGFLYIMAQWRKLRSFNFVPNSGQIWRAVQNGEKSNFLDHCTVLELCRHATEVWLDRSLWIYHTIFCFRFPICNLGNTLLPPENFWGVKFRLFDFAISSYLSTDVLYLLSVWGRRYSSSTPNTLSVFI